MNWKKAHRNRKRNARTELRVTIRFQRGEVRTRTLEGEGALAFFDLAGSGWIREYVQPAPQMIFLK